MKIGQFIKEVETTKDTVRHYEALHLLQPAWENTHRIYGQKEVEDFFVIKEMQSFGLSLTDIQALFHLKRQNGCGNPTLIEGVMTKLEDMREKIEEEEKQIQRKKHQLTETMQAIHLLAGDKNANL
ncbi:MerR family transcriptional regulator [Ornithinibacillus bavariensis]|uniref:HTH merR-type domain-containing protein n=1 Tax=Ornithinibacillus bavariensis TaxID=545502 RepID=A0A919XAW3_9BACI|nr:MerR family transcriptional regulator [Ornithinibacillus bavariensis]GIO28259.1 hypothetical protein J43TS3_28700 [Ornithinibacillus bavariensis]